MAEGRCLLSSFATGDSPNNRGVLASACGALAAARRADGARLNGLLIDRYAPDRPAAYPDAVQRPLYGGRPARPCAGRTHQPECAQPAAASGGDWRARHQIEGRQRSLASMWRKRWPPSAPRWTPSRSYASAYQPHPDWEQYAGHATPRAARPRRERLTDHGNDPAPSSPWARLLVLLTPADAGVYREVAASGGMRRIC